ncbi:MAG: AraC family transcriptional regulator [Kiritimatiellia bacterium]|jgi:AraC-like DNA-binding protein|nr:AraC family transcriptional regulator [Kiritimatiellia bacterium]
MKKPGNTRTKADRLAVIYSDTPERRVFDLSRSGVPEVPALGASRYGHAISPVSAHRHAGCAEIGLCLRGALTLLNNGAEHRIMPGDLYVNKPSDTHCLTAHPKGTVTHWLLIREPKKGQPFLRLTPPEARDLWTRLVRLPCHVVAKTDAVKHAFAQLFKYYGQPPSPYRNVGLTASCTSLLMAVIDASTHKAALSHSQLMEQVIAALREHPERKIRIDDLAREAGLSPSLFISQFKQMTGLPPYHYLLACRLEEAKRLLAATDTPITQFAFDLGFCASQHFSSHFKRAFGMTPRAWRKQAATCR